MTEWPSGLVVHAQLLAVLTVALLACWFDLRIRHLPNALTLGGSAAAALHGLYVLGLAGLATSVLGWCVGLLLFLPLFALRGMGAGDVKLLACMGAWLGPRGAFWTALYASIGGGVMALAWALAAGYLGQALRNISFLLTFWQTVAVRPVTELTLSGSRGPRLPYALPIAAGALTVLWLR